VDGILAQNMLWRPHPKNKPQIAAYISEADVMYYGGSAGGGKSDLLLGLALTDHKKSIIYRREYKQLRELIDRSEEILHVDNNTPAKYSQTAARWDKIPGRRVIEFGAVQHEKDAQNFKGRPHDLIGFDEIPDFSETQFRFLMAWNRTTNPGQRCRVVCTGNPPSTPEGRWVVKYWAPWLRTGYKNPAAPGELRWFCVMNGKDIEVDGPEDYVYHGEVLHPKSRTFIPANVKDNPYFDGTGYLGQLQSLPEPLRSQLLNGNFFIEEAPQVRQVIPTAWIRQAVDRWREEDIRNHLTPTDIGVDPSRGGNDQTVFAPRVEDFFKELVTYEGREVRDGPTLVALFMENFGLEYSGNIKLDIIGIGSSSYDIFDGDTDMIVIAVNFSEGSNATDRTGLLNMRNVRAEAYWTLREALDPESGLQLALPPDEELIEDLAAPRWKRTTTGLLIEDKDAIATRIGRSPGKGDAVAISYLNTSPGILFR